MTPSVSPFDIKRNCLRELNIGHKANVQSPIVKKCLNDIFKLKNSIFVKNPGAHFTLKISTNQRFGTYAMYR